MSNAKAKTINLLLYEGNLNGVISMEDSHWNSGELYSAPRESVTELLETDACSKFGVYLLLSQDMVYIGQSSDLAKRITQHMIGKGWWESVVILTTSNDSLTHTDIDYLEAVLIQKAQKLQQLDCDNRNKGNKPKVSKFRKVELDQYLDEALFLMQLIGITVFSENKQQKQVTFIQTIDVKTKLALGKRAKQDAASFLKTQGVTVGKNFTYAVKRPEKNEFWANPNKKMLTQDWDLVLNDNEKMELLYLHIPENSIRCEAGGKNGDLWLRKDKPELIDLNIETDSLKDRKSGVDFSTFLSKKISYGN